MRRFIAVILCVITVAALFAGCGLIKPDYSFDKVICEYSWGGGFGTMLDTKPTIYTVYADNRIVVTSGYDGCSYSMEIAITEAQKQEIIDAVNRNRVWEIGDISDDSVLDAGSAHISLFDANGQEVYSCGGYAPSSYTLRGRRFQDTASVISQNIPREIIVEVQHEADKLIEESYFN